MMDKKFEYFKELQNMVDYISSCLVIVMIVKNEWFIDKVYDIPFELMLTSIVVAMTWYKVFYWMRLFNTTAFFMNLLTKTFEEVNFRAFFIMTVMMILAFANIIYILNINRGPEHIYRDEDGSLQNQILFPNSLD